MYDQKPYPYCITPITILKSNEATNIETGEVVKLSPEAKLAYVYMMNEYTFYTKRGGKYIESWDRIFTSVCNVSHNKQRSLANELIKLGLVEVIGKKNAHKIVKEYDQIPWVFSNSKLEEFLTPQEQAKRKAKREKDFNDWEEKHKQNGTWEDRGKEKTEKKTLTPPKPKEPVRIAPEPVDHPLYSGSDDPFDPFGDDDDDLLPF